MKTNNKEILKRHLGFLLSIYNFKLKEIKGYEYALYAKFLNSSVGIYFSYEFRDSIPQVQFTKLKTDELEPRAGLYTIKELYPKEDFKLQSFYLDEIILFKGGKEYKSYFEDIKTVEDAIKIIAELIEKYAKDFVTGDEECFAKIETWFRAQVIIN